jgi:hypothetical protein
MKRRINYLIMGLLATASIAFMSCKDDDKLPAIDGYNNSDEVSSTNLVAHWTFDDNTNEVISNTAATKTYGTVGTTAGQIGNALQLTRGAVVYPPIPAINTSNALNNFTVSLWVNVAGNKGTAAPGFTSFFALIPAGVTDVWGDVVAGAETGAHLATSDTLELKGLLNTHPAGASNSLQDNVALKNGDKGSYFMGAKKWSHFVMTWDATTHQFKIYANGTSVGGYDDRGTTGVEIMAVPVQAVFGSVASSDIGFTGASAQPSWNPWATASIDDVRVYNTVLAEKDITALFNLGTASR